MSGPPWCAGSGRGEGQAQRHQLTRRFHRRAPFITKDDIRQFRDREQDPFGGLLCTGYADTTTVFSTSGTTGDATLYAHGWDRWHPFWAATARDLWEIGVRPGDHVLGSGFKMRGPLYHADQMSAPSR